MVTFINKDSTSENVARSTPTERRLINEQSREHRGSARQRALVSSADARAIVRPKNSARRRGPVEETQTQAQAQAQAQAHLSTWAQTQHGIQTQTRTDSADTPRWTSTTITTTTTIIGVGTSESVARGSGKIDLDIDIDVNHDNSGGNINVTTSTRTNTTRNPPPHQLNLITTTTTTTPTRRPSSPPPLTLPHLPTTPGNPLDPFLTTSIPLNASILHLLRYYATTHHATLWSSIEATLATSNPPIDASAVPRCTPTTIVLECMADRTQMYCLLALVASHMAMTTSTSVSTPTNTSIHPSLSGLTTHFLSRATSSLLTSLSPSNTTPPSPGDLLMPALLLYLASTKTGDRAATAAHMAGVKAMVNEILRTGTPVSAPNVAVFALVDGELSGRMLRGMIRGGVGGGALGAKERVVVVL